MDKTEYTQLFSWNEIPGNDNRRLIEFLTQKISIDWVKTAKIEKIDDGMTIRLTDENNFLSLKLNTEKTKVNLELKDGRTYEFIVKIENGKLNIYEYRIQITEEVHDHLYSLANMLRASGCSNGGHRPYNQAIKYAFIQAGLWDDGKE